VRIFAAISVFVLPSRDGTVDKDQAQAIASASASDRNRLFLFHAILRYYSLCFEHFGRFRQADFLIKMLEHMTTVFLALFSHDGRVPSAVGSDCVPSEPTPALTLVSSSPVAAPPFS
jgi:hypothetical protein